MTCGKWKGSNPSLSATIFTSNARMRGEAPVETKLSG